MKQTSNAIVENSALDPSLICIHGKKVCLVGKKLDQLDVNKHISLILNP